MVQAHEDRILVAGGGIAGIALGRALQSRGLPYLIVERKRTPWDGGLAVNLPGNAIQALSDLGLRERIEQLGLPLRRREYRTAHDRLLFSIDEDDFWGPALRPRSIRRSDLLSMLAEGLPDGMMRFDVEVQSVAADAIYPELSLSDGSRIKSPLVVGADGVHSRIRSHAFGSDAGRGHALIAEKSWRFMVPNPGVDCWTVWAGADGMMLLMPVGDDAVYGWVALTRPEDDSDPLKSLARVADQFPARASDAIRHALGSPSGLYHSPLEEIRLDRWHRGRTVLIGDAAHATAPVWAEGVALALEDAIVLARCISVDSDIPAALLAFESARRPRVAHVQAATDAMSRAAKLPVFLRDVLLPIVGPKRYRQVYGPLKRSISS